MLEEIQKVRKTGLTLAPEAGTQRMRDVINKGVTEENLLDTVRTAFEKGWGHVKLYFMIGLPGETLTDIEGIADLGQKVVDEYFESRFKHLFLCAQAIYTFSVDGPEYPGRI
jgi:radical SAM superfamily enzyme YgiQ (UPF0313 family)